MLDKTRLPLSKWLQAIWYVTEETGGVSALSLQRSLGLGSYETAWAMLHKLRRAMEPTSGKLEGTVEVDESFVGGDEPGVRGRLTRWILGTHQGAVSKELLDYYLAEFAFRYNRRYSRHRGLLFYRLAEQAMQTEPKPYVELLAPRASKARKRKVKAGRKKRAAGLVGKPVNVPRLQPKRPGGKLTKLTDSATAKRRFAVKGRRGL